MAAAGLIAPFVTFISLVCGSVKFTITALQQNHIQLNYDTGNILSNDLQQYFMG
jgi:hypothetical protein